MIMEKTQNIEEVVIKLRKARPDDLKTDAKNLKFGQAIWLRSQQTGHFMAGPLRITRDIDIVELTEWLRNEMIYVPVQWHEKLIK